MRVSIESLTSAKAKARAWIVPVFEGRLAETGRTHGLNVTPAKAWGFTGELRQSLPLLEGPRGRLVLLVGAGRREALTTEAARRILAAGLRHEALLRAVPGVVLFSATDLEGAAASREQLLEALAEAALLASHTFTDLKGRGTARKSLPKFPDRLVLALPRIREADRRRIEQAVIMAEWSNWGRELLAQSQSHITAAELASAARRVAARMRGVRCRVLGPRDLKALKMGLLLAVNQGSTAPARFVELRYSGGRKRGAPVVLIGKGVTYDTGGYNLKPGDGMRGMHMDKGGGVAAMASFFSAVAMRLPLNLVCLMPATDNRISGAAMCPGDVYTGVSGISVEIDNTDAEGRLILADALGYATRFKPSHIVDLATLTGAAVVALGDQATALFSNDDRLADQILRCAREADELVWRLPLWSEYEEKLKSVTADVKNAGGRWAGAITAALFLRKFVPPGVKWCHLDMAGRMKAESDQAYHALGLPYGFGPRLLGRWLRSLSASL